MSLDMTVWTDDECIELNWLRNPYGLCNWAEDNCQELTDRLGRTGLWYMCNTWAYDRGVNVQKKFFKFVVDAYWKQIDGLTEGYFFFGLPAYRQFVEPNMSYIATDNVLAVSSPRIIGAKYVGHRIAIPTSQFRHKVFMIFQRHRFSTVLEQYKEWFRKLVKAADLLQEPGAQFRVSN